MVERRDGRLDRPVILIGLMGAGKSTIGRRLGARLGIPFVDADAEIEKAAGSSIEDIFATLLRLVGQPVPAAVQGYDLESSWVNGTPSPRPDIVTRFRNGEKTDGWVARTDEWRYIHDIKNNEEHLYAIDIDPDEETDLIDVVDPADLVVFDQLIDQWQERN